MNYKLLIFIGLMLLVGTVAADSLVIPGSTLAVNQHKTVIVRLSATDGLSGYNITFTMENSTVAQIYGVAFPSWAVLHSSDGDPGAVVTTVAADLGDAVTAPVTNENIVSLTLKGLAAGSTTLSATVNQIDDDDGGVVTPSITNATIIVTASNTAAYPDRPKATATIAMPDNASYELLLDFLGSGESWNETSGAGAMNWTALLEAIYYPYNAVFGSLAGVLIFAIPFMMGWIRQRDMTVPGIVGIIFGAFIVLMLPAAYHIVAWTFIAFSVTAVIYSLLKE